VKFENSLVVIKSKNQKYLVVLKEGGEFVTENGKIEYNQIKKLPSIITTSTGDTFKIYSPSYKEFVLLMKRGPQIIYPKDVGQIIIEGNIFSNSKVLELGTGSGALTLYLILILGDKGKLISLDVDNKNQYRAKKTIERYLSTFNNEFKFNLDLINSDLANFKYSDIQEKVDVVITDLPEPWKFFDFNKIENQVTWVSYLPSITQVEKLTHRLHENNFENIEVKEILERSWIIKDKIIRPMNEMVGHTGFVVSGRLIT
tara:strand:+ start:2155 stop:2928 length:774 start_codon:yes stop_codon:yes gene_type:complete